MVTSYLSTVHVSPSSVYNASRQSTAIMPDVHHVAGDARTWSCSPRRRNHDSPDSFASLALPFPLWLRCLPPQHPAQRPVLPCIPPSIHTVPARLLRLPRRRSSSSGLAGRGGHTPPPPPPCPHSSFPIRCSSHPQGFLRTSRPAEMWGAQQASSTPCLSEASPAPSPVRRRNGTPRRGAGRGTPLFGIRNTPLFRTKHTGDSFKSISSRGSKCSMESRDPTFFGAVSASTLRRTLKCSSSAESASFLRSPHSLGVPPRTLGHCLSTPRRSSVTRPGPARLGERS